MASESEDELIRAIRARNDARRTGKDEVVDKVVGGIAIIVTAVLIIGAVQTVLAHV